MGTPIMGEIKIISWNYAPKGWALCNGQFLPINQNQALFSLLGTTYGGNGQTTFALPDLRGRVPIHVGKGFLLGGVGGEENHTLTQSEGPTHTHVLQASTQAGNASPPNPVGNTFADSAPALGYNAGTNLVALNPNTVTSVGGSQPHTNQQPYLTLNFIIALTGVFPSRN
jgi:microcystin-dependent protein